MKFFGRKAPQTQTSGIDPAMGDTKAAELRAQLAKGKWEPVHQFLETVRDWDDRQFFVEVLTEEVPGRPRWIEDWTKAQPSSSVPHLVRGAHGIKWAWEARGGGREYTVKEEAWRIFWQRLEEAERELQQAAQLDPADPVPWAYLIISARGLEKPAAEQTERLRQAHQRHPWHQYAFHQAVGSLAKKWGGSHELMFDIARQALNGAPEGEPVHRVVADAHVERWLYMAAFDKDEAGARNYFTTPTVQEEIRLAAARSVFSPRYRATRFSPWDQNTFTYCFFRMQDWPSAQRSLAATQGIVTRWPWAFAGSPMQVFQTARQRITQGA